MQRLRKIRVSIIGLIISALLCIAGIFGVSFGKDNRVMASAAESTSEYLVFLPGASINLSETGDYGKIRFGINIYDDVFSSETDTLQITFSEEEMENGAYMYTAWFNDGKNNTQKQEIEGDRIRLTSNDCPFDEEGKAFLIVYVNAQVSVDLQLQATVYAGETISAQAVSDVRSIAETWELLRDAGYLDTYGEFQQGYINGTLENIEKANTSNAFELYDTVNMSQENGVTFQLSLPNTYKELLKSRESDWDAGFIEQEYSEYYLVVARSATTDVFSTLTGATLPSGTGAAEYYYFGYQDLQNYDMPWFYSKKYKERFSANRWVSDFTKLPDVDSNFFEINIPITTDAETEYYYGAFIVKATYYVKMAGAITLSTNLEVCMAEKTSSAPFSFSERTIAEQFLSDEKLTLSETERQYLLVMSGLASSGSTPIILSYKGMSDNMVIEKTFTYNIDTVYAHLQSVVVDGLKKINDFDFVYNSISDLNVLRKTTNYDADGTGYCLDRRIILTADSFSYRYDSAANTGYLTTVYDAYSYGNLPVRITNNAVENNLTMDYYTAYAVDDGETVTLTYKFDEIEAQLWNVAKWNFVLTSENIVVSGKTGNVNVVVSDEEIVVTVPSDETYDLINLSLTATAEIEEAYALDASVTYKRVYWNGTKISEETKLYTVETEFYTTNAKKYQDPIFGVENFLNVYGEMINAALEFNAMFDVTYANPSAIGVSYENSYEYTAVYNGETRTQTRYQNVCMTVIYEYFPVFQISNNYDGSEIWFLNVEKNNVAYHLGEDVIFDIPSGWRVEQLESLSDYVTITPYADAPDNVAKAEIEVRVSASGEYVFPIKIIYTDGWNINITYFETYVNSAGKTTPFALKKILKTEVTVAQYPDIYAITKAQITSLLGKTDLVVCGMVDADEKATVKFDNVSTYDITVNYGVASLIQRDYNGSGMEIQVPITGYIDWLASMGNDNWTILMLNTEKDTYFKYSNEVAREDVYGFFSVAVFDEQVSDFNYWFKNNTGDGCMTIFQKEEVKGSAAYSFFDGLRGKGVVTSLIGHVGMAFCELVNDENVIQHSYFFYMDGSNPNAFISNGGADNAFDDDSSFGNAVEDAGNWVGSLFAGDDAWKNILQAAFGIVCIGGGIAVVVWIMKKAGLIGGGSAASNTPKKKTTARTTKKKTQTTKSKSGSKKK